MPEELQVLLWHGLWLESALKTQAAEQPNMVTCRQHFLQNVDDLLEYLDRGIIRKQLEQGGHKLLVKDECLGRVGAPVLGGREALQVDFVR